MNLHTAVTGYSASAQAYISLLETELNAAKARIAELEQELAMSKSQFEAVGVAFTDNQRRLAELEKDKARLDHMDAITQPKGFRGHIDAAMGGYK
jgi:predicted  nucleic acid-binding Zn-ribbon protein